MGRGRGDKAGSVEQNFTTTTKAAENVKRFQDVI